MFIEFFIKCEVDIEVHHLQILVDLLINKRNVFLNDKRKHVLGKKIVDVKPYGKPKEETKPGSGLGLGSMNLSNPKKNIPYTSSILGNNMSVATGYALGNKMKTNNVTINEVLPKELLARLHSSRHAAESSNQPTANASKQRFMWRSFYRFASRRRSRRGDETGCPSNTRRGKCS